MIEIKYLKELPIRLLNSNKNLLDINGADIYVDKDLNRFAFIEFKNNNKKPLFALYFVLKQYDANGSFISEIKFSLPNIYYKRGKFVNEIPVKLDEECDGVELFITYAEFSNIYFYKDKTSKIPALGLEIQNYFESVPDQISKSVAENVAEVKEAPSNESEEVSTTEAVEGAPSEETLKQAEEVKPEEETPVTEFAIVRQKKTMPALTGIICVVLCIGFFYLGLFIMTALVI